MKNIKNKVNNNAGCLKAMRMFIFTLFFTVFVFSLGAKAATIYNSVSSYINHTQVQQDQQATQIVMPAELTENEESSENIDSESKHLLYFVLSWIGGFDTHEKTSVLHYYSCGDSSPTISSPIFIKNQNLRI